LTSLSAYVKIRGRSAFRLVFDAFRKRFSETGAAAFGPAESKAVAREPHAIDQAHYGEKTALSVQVGVGLKAVVLGLAVALALIAGWTDWRSRRIPNWLTVPGFLIGVSVNVIANGLPGLKASLLGAGLGLLVLLPFVFLRSLGAGDWKLAGALGAFLGWQVLVDLLMGSVFVAGVMALVLVIYKGRFKETLRNIGRLCLSMLTLRMPGPEVSLDNPQSLKVPYGVALALTTLLFVVGEIWGTKIWGAR
jgi:prepilin peptidase CpaA